MRRPRKPPFLVAEDGSTGPVVTCRRVKPRHVHEGVTVRVALADRVVPGAVVQYLKDPDRPFAHHGIAYVQIGALPEDGGVACTCLPTVEDSGPDPACLAVHAEYANLDEVDLHFDTESS
jgi:hypothetical protein